MRWPFVLLLVASLAHADDTSYELHVSRDGQHVVASDPNAFAMRTPFALHIYAAAGGAEQKSLTLAALSKLPANMYADDGGFAQALAGNAALAQELKTAGQLMREFPTDSTISTSDDGEVVIAGRERRWVLLAGDALSALPEKYDEPMVTPDGKAIIYSDRDAHKLYRYDLATKKSKLLVSLGSTSFSRGAWAVSADRKTLRVPYGDGKVCIADVPLAGAKATKPKCYASESAEIISLSNDAHWLAFRTPGHVHLVDLAKKTELRDLAGLELGRPGDGGAFALVMSSLGRAFAVHGAVAYEIDAAGAPVTLSHDPTASSCAATDTKLVCYLGGQLVIAQAK